VFGRGYNLFLAITGGLFAIIAIAIPMVIIASSLAEGTGSGPPVTAAPDLPGEAIAASTGCVACHSNDGSELVGPSWQGIYGTERALESGETVLADDEYVTESIVDPLAKIVAGFQPVMPEGYDGQLSEQDIADIVDYIESLS
jgi:cytochrome c oxidase subunit 2